MKTILKKNILAYSGKDPEQGVIYTFQSFERNCYAKKPKTHYNSNVENQTFKSNSKVIANLWKTCSPLFKADLKIYCDSLNNKNKNLHISKLNKYHLFLRILFKVSQDYQIDMNDEILIFMKQNNLDTISSLIEHKYLENIRDRNKYNYK